MEYTLSWLFIAVLIVAAVVFALVPLFIARLVAPHKPGPTKVSTYECGLESKGDAWIQFKAQYYVYALIFAIFDIEVVFVLPWAVAFNKLGVFAFVEMVIFLGILVGGLVYAWGKGALKWT